MTKPHFALHHAAPGRHGRKDGPAGVTITIETPVAEATVIAARGRHADVLAAAKAAFGLELPVTPRRAVSATMTATWSAPGQWWLRDVRPDASGFVRELEAAFGVNAAIADQTDGRVLIRIEGPEARSTLAKGVPIDLDAAVFAEGAAAVTIASHIGVQLVRLPGEAAFELAVSRSWADSFWHWLEASAAEYGFDVVQANGA